MSTTIIFTLIIIGIFAGLLSGLIGVGGGIILVPCLVYFLNYSQHQAQGTSLGVLTFPVIMLAFLIYFHKFKGTDNAIQMNVVFVLAIGFIIGSIFGSKLSLKIDEKIIKRLFAVVLLYTAFKLLDWDKMLLKWIRH